jgi:hypothetical protein
MNYSPPSSNLLKHHIQSFSSECPRRIVTSRAIVEVSTDMKTNNVR